MNKKKIATIFFFFLTDMNQVNRISQRSSWDMMVSVSFNGEKVALFAEVPGILPSQ